MVSGDGPDASHKLGAAEVDVEVTLASARDLKNTRKLMGRMSPCAVLSVPDAGNGAGSSSSSGGSSVCHCARDWGGSNPLWDQTVTLSVPETILQSTAPRPTVQVEIFDSPAMQKSLGVALLPLAPAVAHYEEKHSATAQVIRKGKPHGTLKYSVRCCSRPSFAPPKSSGSDYAAFEAAMLPPAPMLAQRSPGPVVQGATPGMHLHAPPGYAANPYPAYGGGHGYAHPPAPGHHTAGYPPPPAYAYPPPGYGHPPGYRAPPPGYAGYPYAQPPAVVVVDQRHGRGSRGMGGGMGAGLLAGAAGGLLLGAALTDGF